MEEEKNVFSAELLTALEIAKKIDLLKKKA